MDVLVGKTLNSFRRIFESPETQYLPQNSRAERCTYLWSYYENSMFDKFVHDSASLSKYKETYDLYRFTRLLQNPTRRLVDFYVGALYPGLLSPSGDRMIGGQLSAIPFNKKTDPKIKLAISQFWTNSNFQSAKSLLSRYTAAVGECLIEVLDMPDKGQVVADVVWPGYITYLILDKMGNVKSYTVTYKVMDKDGSVKTYRKEVNNMMITEYIGNEVIRQVLHGYTFCPAVWIKHIDEGNDDGAPAVQGSIGKIDELNSLASHASDLTHKLIESPMIFWTDGTIKNVLGASPAGADLDGDDFGPDPANSQQSHMLLKGPKDGRIDTLAPKVELQSTLEQMKLLIADIEADHPEITMYRELRSMAQISGPSVSRVVNDAISKVTEPAANADRQLTKLFQMVLAISGERANGGYWGPNLLPTQQVFLPFNLDSYGQGDLAFSIDPRPLIPETQLEKATTRKMYFDALQSAKDVGFPVETLLLEDEWDPEVIAKYTEQVQANVALAQQAFSAQLPGNTPNNQPAQLPAGDTVPASGQ